MYLEVSGLQLPCVPTQCHVAKLKHLHTGADSCGDDETDAFRTAILGDGEIDDGDDYYYY